LEAYVAIIVLVHMSGEQGLVEVSSTNVCLCHMQWSVNEQQNIFVSVWYSEKQLASWYTCTYCVNGCHRASNVQYQIQWNQDKNS